MLGHSVKFCNPTPEQYCRTAGVGSLERCTDPVPGECKAVMVFYTLEFAMLGSENLQASYEFNLSTWACLLEWLLMLRTWSIAATKFLLTSFTSAIVPYTCFSLRASLEINARALWRQPCRTAELAFGGDTVRVTSLWRHVCKGKGLLYWHQIPLPASTPTKE